MPQTGTATAEIFAQIDTYKAGFVDAGCRRHLSTHMDFDTRASIFKFEMSDGVSEENRRMMEMNRERTREGLIWEFGAAEKEGKLKNFIDLDIKPMSIISYHNAFYEQARISFVMGAYYPALVSACALGERILNHLVIDLRDCYKGSDSYRKIYRKSSFDDWRVPIKALTEWNVLLPGVAETFQKLMMLRNRSIHFDAGTYVTIRNDALAAIHHMRSIIETQFGSFGQQPWFVSGTRGQIFIKKQFEEHPFIKRYFVPICPFVGPLFNMEYSQEGWAFSDFQGYGEIGLSDEEYVIQFNDRDVSKLAPNKIG